MRFYSILFILLSLIAAPLLRAQQPADFKSAHQRQSEYYGSLGLETEAEWDTYFNRSAAPQQRAGSCNLRKKVYGWHPYWMGTSYTSYDWDLLSTFSYFSYELDPLTGNYNSIHSWKTTNSIPLAQAAGCRVELSVTNFGGTNNTNFLTNAAAQQLFIDSIIVLINYRNADGVNIDFEGIPGAQRNNFTTFMQNLSTQLKAAIPGASVSMALYAVDWNNVFDIPNLDPYVDEFIIMGYDYYWSGSADAGPTDPLYSGSIWWSYNLNRSVLYYIGQGITRDKLLVGLPYYSHEYRTAANTYPSTNTGYVSSRTYAYAQNNYEGVHSKTWDDHSRTSGYTWWDGASWRQLWIDDVQAYDEKFELPDHKNIGGIGIWALGYDNPYADLWDLIRNKLSYCGPDYCADTLWDSGGPMGQYRNNEDYSWTIQSPSGQNVRAEFLEFDLELNYDYMYVYDGPSTASPLIGFYSGSTAPGPFTSTGDALTFRFDSDGATLADGWKLAWECQGPSVYEDTIRMDRTDSALINCGIAYHVFMDSDTMAGGLYGNNEHNYMTFCAPNPAQAVMLQFRMNVAPVQLDLKSTVDGNDFLSFFDGPDTNANAIGVYTGSTSAYPQPGTVISSGQCLTVQFDSDGNSTGEGWEATLRCYTPPADSGVRVVSQGAPLLFEDTGGSGNYGNGESYTVTYCPSPADLAAGRVIWADFGAVEIEENYDYLQVYDGDGKDARLICTYTGNSLDSNDLQIIKATVENSTGCLTFEFYSDGATTHGGWSASMQVGAARLEYGADACTDATLIAVSEKPYAGSTTLAHGYPNSEDPQLNISLISLPECSGPNTITRLENSIWYKFNTPSSACTSSEVNFLLENISCQNSIPGGNGAQFMLYDAATCQTGAGWGSPIYCSDKLLQDAPVNVAGLIQPSKTYYVLVDGFAGQHCNLDLILTGDIDGCILPIELVDFRAELQEGFVALNWETALEQNNAGFYVQRGLSGMDGEIDYEDIGFVNANPNSLGTGAYTFDDPDYRRDRVNFYRLRQLDLNGASHFHKVVAVQPELAGGMSLDYYPVPARDRLNFRLLGSDVTEGSMDVLDVRGRVLESRSVTTNVSGEWSLNLEGYSPGIYFFRIRWDGESLTGKFIVE